MSIYSLSANTNVSKVMNFLLLRPERVLWVISSDPWVTQTIKFPSLIHNVFNILLSSCNIKASWQKICEASSNTVLFGQYSQHIIWEAPVWDLYIESHFHTEPWQTSWLRNSHPQPGSWLGSLRSKAPAMEKRQLWLVVATLANSTACCLPAEICIWPLESEHAWEGFTGLAHLGLVSQTQDGDAV